MQTEGRYNLIAGNAVEDNSRDGGITLISNYLPITTGISDNTITHNRSSRNGLSAGGAGVSISSLSARFSIAVRNAAIGNELSGNGGAGIAWATKAEFADEHVFAGNVISGNGGPGGAGITITGPVFRDTVTGNVFKNEAIGLSVTDTVAYGPVVVTAHLNSFSAHGIGVRNANPSIGDAKVDATANWWGCPGGPARCSGVSGTEGGVLFAPWLTMPPVPPFVP